MQYPTGGAGESDRRLRGGRIVAMMAPPLWAGGIGGSPRGYREDEDSTPRRLQLDTRLLDPLEVMSESEFRVQLKTHASLQSSLAEWNNRFSPLLAGSPERETYSPNVAAHTAHRLRMWRPEPEPEPEPEPQPQPEPQPVRVPVLSPQIAPGLAAPEPTPEAERQLQPAEVSLGSLRGPLRRGELQARLGPQAYAERRRQAALARNPTALESPMSWVEDTTGPAVRAALRDCMRLGSCDAGTRLRALASSLRRHAQTTSDLGSLFPEERVGDQSVRSDECDAAEGARPNRLDGSGSLCGDVVVELLSEALWNVYVKAPPDPMAMLAQLLETAASEH